MFINLKFLDKYLEELLVLLFYVIINDNRKRGASGSQLIQLFMGEKLLNDARVDLTI